MVGEGPLRFAVALLLVAAGCSASGATTGPATARGPVHATPPTGTLEGRHFVVYGSDGRRTSLEEVVGSLAAVEVALVGEEHDDPFGHAVELELLQRAYERYGGVGRRRLVLSLEMFERDVQAVLDEYLGGFITEEHFLASSRPWDNYADAYRPLVEFSRAHSIPVVAANAPRRYVNRASRLGRESLRELPGEARRWLPALPYPEPSAAYRTQWDSLMGSEAGHASASPLDAQMLWDATMGESIARALGPGGQDAGSSGTSSDGPLVVHVVGGFHVEEGTGIPETLEHYRPGTRRLVVALVPVDDVTGFRPEHAGLADFVVLTGAR